MINILIADDHAVVRRGLKQILQEQPDLVVGGEATNATEVLELVQAEDELASICLLYTSPSPRD